MSWDDVKITKERIDDFFNSIDTDTLGQSTPD